MATTARSRIRAMLAWATDQLYFSGTNTGTATDAVTDADISRFDTGRLRDKWVLITSGNRSGESRRISVTASTTSTLVAPLSGALANADTFEILPHDPDIMNEAIARGIRSAWPRKVGGRGADRGLYSQDPDETLVVDNLLLNPSLDTGTFTSWTDIGTPTKTANTTRRVHGTGSAQIAATGATEGIEQDILALLDIDQIVGKTLRFQGWVWASVASAVRLRVTQDGSTFTNGPWHGGDDEWEGPSIQQVDHTILTGATELTVSCEATDGNTGYFDLVSAWIDPISRYTMPTGFYPNGPSRILVQRYLDRPEGLYLPIGSRYLSSGYVLRLEGVRRLTVPTTDAGTTEVDEVEAELIVAEAAAHMYEMLGEEAKRNSWKFKADEIRGQVGQLFLSADEHLGWHLSSDSRILILER